MKNAQASIMMKVIDGADTVDTWASNDFTILISSKKLPTVLELGVIEVKPMVVNKSMASKLTLNTLHAFTS